jgi:hypothetical protein
MLFLPKSILFSTYQVVRKPDVGVAGIGKEDVKRVKGFLSLGMEYSEASRDLSACLQVGFRYSNGCVPAYPDLLRSWTAARLNGITVAGYSCVLPTLPLNSPAGAGRNGIS